MNNNDFPKNIIGISFVGDSGVSLYQNGILKLAVNEERFTRIKLDGTFPKKSIDWILKEAKLKATEIDLICFVWSNGMKSKSFELELNQKLKKYSI